MQQSFVIEYMLSNKQCGSCQRREAKDTWTAVVQVTLALTLTLTLTVTLTLTLTLTRGPRWCRSP